MQELHPVFVQPPWHKDTLRLPHEPVGMLGGREAALFYHLARSWFTGRGTIIDAGSFLGKSAFFFGHGLRANPCVDAKRHRVHCFDNFLVNDLITIDFIKQWFGQTLALGASTRSFFDRQVAPVRDLLEVHEGDFHTVPWKSQPIELLMVDIAKSRSLWRRVVESFFPDLVPGTSLLVHQDYHHPWLPFIHVAMEYLADYFEICEPRADDSAAWLYVRRIPQNELERVARYEFTTAEQLQLMDKAIARLPQDARHYLELARIVLRLESAEAAVVRPELDSVEARYPSCRSEASWANYLRDVRDRLDEIDGWKQREKGDHARAMELADGLIRRGKRNTYTLLLRGASMRALRHPDAESVIRDAIAARPYSGYAGLELALLFADRGEFAAAEEQVLRTFSDSEVIQPPTRAYCDTFAAIWSRAGAVQDCLLSLAKLQKSLPTDPEVWALSARVHHQLGRTADSVKDLQRARELGLEESRLGDLCSLLGVSRVALQV